MHIRKCDFIDIFTFREYLGKQLEKEQTGSSGAPGTKAGTQVPAKA